MRDSDKSLAVPHMKRLGSIRKKPAFQSESGKDIKCKSFSFTFICMRTKRLINSSMFLPWSLTFKSECQETREVYNLIRWLERAKIHKVYPGILLLPKIISVFFRLLAPRTQFINQHLQNQKKFKTYAYIGC